MAVEFFPKLESLWRHRNGNRYEVIAIANDETTRPEKYPVTVVYRNIETGSTWSRRLDDWHRSMTEIK